MLVVDITKVPLALAALHSIISVSTLAVALSAFKRRGLVCSAYMTAGAILISLSMSVVMASIVEQELTHRAAYVVIPYIPLLSWALRTNGAQNGQADIACRKIGLAYTALIALLVVEFIVLAIFVYVPA